MGSTAAQNDALTDLGNSLHYKPNFKLEVSPEGVNDKAELQLRSEQLPEDLWPRFVFPLASVGSQHRMLRRAARYRQAAWLHDIGWPGTGLGCRFASTP